MFDNAVQQGAEAVCVAKCALVDRIEDGGELWVKRVLLVEMGVTQVLDVFGEVAEEENVLLADFAGDFDLVGT